MIIFNGSPRRKKSNSKILIDNFLKGYNSVEKDEVAVHYLASTKRIEDHKKHFNDADTVLIFFPLYTDSMPGIVKYFIEAIADMENNNGKKVGFVVQSGFPEAYHSVFVEKYLEKLCKKLGFEYIGTVIKGGVEGIQIMPPNMTKKLFAAFENLGVIFAKTGKFDTEIVEKLKKPYHLSKMRLGIIKAMSLTGMTNFYWNSNLKKNNAFDKRFDRPYEL